MKLRGASITPEGAGNMSQSEGARRSRHWASLLEPNWLHSTHVVPQNVTRLHYGVPNEALQQALSPFGKIISIKVDSYQGVYVGVRNVLAEIMQPIPFSLRIANHWCNIFYVGQTPTCFQCKQVGHTRSKCPNAIPTLLML